MAGPLWHRPRIPWTLFCVSAVLVNSVYCLSENRGQEKVSTRLKTDGSLSDILNNPVLKYVNSNNDTKEEESVSDSVKNRGLDDNMLNFDQSDGITKCMFNENLMKCLKVNLLTKVQRLLVMTKERKLNATVELMDGLVTLETTPADATDARLTKTAAGNWSREDDAGDAGDKALNVMLLSALSEFFRGKSLKLRFIPGLTLRVSPARSTAEYVRFSVEFSGENVKQVLSRTMKMGGMMSSPWMMIGPMITLGMFPFMLANLKYMVMNAFMINNMALMMALRTTVNNIVFGDKEGDNIVYRNKGYSNEYTNRPQDYNRPIRYRVKPYNQINPPIPKDPPKALRLRPSKPYHHSGGGGSLGHAYHAGSTGHAHHGGSVGHVHHASLANNKPDYAKFPQQIDHKPSIINPGTFGTHSSVNGDGNKVKYIAEHDYFGDSHRENPPIKQHSPVIDYNAFGKHQAGSTQRPEYNFYKNNGYQVHEHNEATHNVDVYAKHNNNQEEIKGNYASTPIKYESNHDYSGNEFENLNTNNFQHSFNILQNTFEEPKPVNHLNHHQITSSDHENTYEHQQSLQKISGVEDGYHDGREATSYASKLDQTTSIPLVDHINNEEWVAKDVQPKQSSNWPIIYDESPITDQKTYDNPSKNTEVGTVFPVFPGVKEPKHVEPEVLTTQNDVQLTSGIRFSSVLNNGNQNGGNSGDNFIISSPLRQEQSNFGFGSQTQFGNGEVIIVSPHESKIQNNNVHNKAITSTRYGNGEVINVSPYDNEPDIIFQASKDLNDENEFVNFPQRLVQMHPGKPPAPTPHQNNNENIIHKLGVIIVFDEASTTGDRASPGVSNRSGQSDDGSLTVRDSMTSHRRTPSEEDVEERIKRKKLVTNSNDEVEPLYPFREA